MYSSNPLLVAVASPPTYGRWSIEAPTRQALEHQQQQQQDQEEEEEEDEEMAMISNAIQSDNGFIDPESSINGEKNSGFEQLQALQEQAADLRALHAAVMKKNGSKSSPLVWSKSNSRPPAPPKVRMVSKDYPIFKPAYEDMCKGVSEWELSDRSNTMMGRSAKAIAITKAIQLQASLNASMASNTTTFTTNNNTSSSSHQHSLQTSMDSEDSLIKPSYSSNNNSKRSTTANPQRRSLSVVQDDTGSEEGSINCSNCYPTSANTAAVSVVLSSKHSSNSSINPIKAWFMRGRKKPPPSTPAVEKKEEDDEVVKLKLTMGEMGEKMKRMESYCEGLKQALDYQVVVTTPKPLHLSLNSIQDRSSTRGRANVPSSPSITRPSTREFRHAAAEARVSVKQLCRTLLQEMQEDGTRLSRKHRYRLESLVNGSFYQDFENIGFQAGGSHCILDPHLRCHAFYQSFLSISRVGCDELLSKDSSSHYSESFDAFCEQKMNLLHTSLSWKGGQQWPDRLVDNFFSAARSVWLVHLLAFSFDPIATIFRVGKEADFDPKYMEEISVDRKKRNRNDPAAAAAATSFNMGLRAMVMPGFFVGDEIVKCKVLCNRE